MSAQSKVDARMEALDALLTAIAPVQADRVIITAHCADNPTALIDLEVQLAGACGAYAEAVRASLKGGRPAPSGS